MAGSIETRVRRLEEAGVGEECPRCAGVFAVTMNGEFSSASKNGEAMTEGEWRAFEAEEDEEGRCPLCERKPHDIRVGWPAP